MYMWSGNNVTWVKQFHPHQNKSNAFPKKQQLRFLLQLYNYKHKTQYFIYCCCCQVFLKYSFKDKYYFVQHTLEGCILCTALAEDANEHETALGAMY